MKNVKDNRSSQRAKLTSLRKKIIQHLHSDTHIKAKDIMTQQEKNNTLAHVDVINSKYLDTTKRVFRTSYYISKNDKPLGDHQGLVDLQSQNGVDMGIGLHSRFSATALIDHIVHDMRSTICKNIKQNQGIISILIDDSCTISDISTLIIYLNVQLETSGEPQFLFLDLVKLTNVESTKGIHSELVACLKRHTFGLNICKKHFIAFTSGGASVLTGRKSGVMELLVKDFPKIITWHCLNHRL
ncbi:hypothetical protein LOD99_15568 [Oopsacas minuta]|uniref:E3 SUMO-protein ligase KIAA1586-like n=1 Tax=Oopsacas minuta TaxID=111878 RepID=A0AAV7KCH7_9METZ|nr:hypothetical protein LOD99_15568 [Oopsacas minuta]